MKKRQTEGKMERSPREEVTMWKSGKEILTKTYPKTQPRIGQG